MSRLTDLLQSVSRLDPKLGTELSREFQSVVNRQSFGLVFEKHQPEAVELPLVRPSRGATVRILPPRGTVNLSKEDDRLWTVSSVNGTGKSRTYNLVEQGVKDFEVREGVSNDDLVTVSIFQDAIYPGLVETGRVIEADDENKPAHVVLNAENYHALQLLTFTHRHKIDAIYIDPPYNTGAKDWKYNNHYVGEQDSYRHSKWLSFMERRLKIAKELLNPQDSVLIVTIDESEYLRLGMLLEQVFPHGRQTMVAAAINKAGASRRGTFGRSAEYIFFVQFGDSAVKPLPLESEWNPVGTKNKSTIYWNRLIRSGTHALREDSANQFYPIFIRNTEKGPVFDSVGEPFYGADLSEVKAPDGCVAVWPIRQGGAEGNWQISPVNLRKKLDEGFAKLGKWRGADTTVYYLKQGEVRKVRNGTYNVVGTAVDGSIEVDTSDYEMSFVPTDVWSITAHDAGNSGSRLVAKFLPGRKFPYPKSLYAVEDALRFFVKDKPNATILDFFAGSGTTAHAVMRLNREDNGARRSISVTNNEVGDEKTNPNNESRLRQRGLRPGDPEWEKWGICDYITKPRITAAITGLTPEGIPVKGDYKFNQEFPMLDGFKENAVFYTLRYLSPNVVTAGMAFKAIAPLLWLSAGQQGRLIEDFDERGWDVTSYYGVIQDLDNSSGFIEAVHAAACKTAFIITDDDGAFQMVAQAVPEGVETHRLYESYLDNFEIINQ